MINSIRFHNPGRQFGARCEKCHRKMKEHAYIDVDDRGRIVGCSINEGIEKEKRKRGR